MRREAGPLTGRSGILGRWSGDRLRCVGARGVRSGTIRARPARGENAIATRTLSFELLSTLCTPGSVAGCSLTPGVPTTAERLGSAGIGAASITWTPHLPGDSDPQRLAVYARTLWANDPGSFSPLGKTFQGGIGIRVHPFQQIPLFLWAERMIKLGGESQNNWLLRATAGWDTGTAWRAGGTDSLRHGWEPYASVYGDVARLLQVNRDWLVAAEGRLGGSIQPREQLKLIPYAFVRYELDSAKNGSDYSVQVGAGLSLRLRFFDDPLLGYLFEPELFARVAQDIARSGGKTGTRFLFGIVSRF